jgi:hypothetical protein
MKHNCEAEVVIARRGSLQSITGFAGADAESTVVLVEVQRMVPRFATSTRGVSDAMSEYCTQVCDR